MATTLETAPTKGNRKPPKEPKAPKAPKEPKQAKAPKAPKEQGAKKPKQGKAPAAPVWPTSVKPSLVFLPDAIRNSQAYKRSIRQAMLMSVGLLAATAVVYGGTATAGLSAKSDLDRENGRTATLKADIASNQQVQEYYDGFILSKKAVSNILSSDTSYSKVLNEIASANTVGATFKSIVKKTDDACPTGDPFSPAASIGCFELSGGAPSMADATAFLAQLQTKTEMLTSPYIQELGTDNNGATFKITVGYTKAAYSGKGGEFVPTAQEIAALNSSADATTAAPAAPAAAGTGVPAPAPAAVTTPAEGGTKK